MQQFNLDTWLQDKSRKIVTRRGNSVRIICTDRKHGEDNLPVVFLEESPDGIGEFLLSCRADGTCDSYDTPYDLFFADEEEGLTEFEKALLAAFNCVAGKAVTTISTASFQEDVDEWIKPLLDLARKELEKEDWRKPLMAYKNGYKQGKLDDLKDLPKWKKFLEEYKELDSHAILLEDNKRVVLTEYLEKGDYYIELSELEKLPKEE